VYEYAINIPLEVLILNNMPYYYCMNMPFIDDFPIKTSIKYCIQINSQWFWTVTIILAVSPPGFFRLRGGPMAETKTSEAP